MSDSRRFAIRRNDSSWFYGSAGDGKPVWHEDCPFLFRSKGKATRAARSLKRQYASLSTDNLWIVEFTWTIPPKDHPSPVAKPEARDCNGRTIRVGDIVHLAYHVPDIEGSARIAALLQLAHGTIDDIRQNPYRTLLLVDYPGTVFRAVWLDPKDVEYVTSDHGNWDGKEAER